ncbi:hypothetical protein GCM10028791_12300 [Echinicola sediminis]
MELIYKREAFEIVGAAMDVHRHLGAGFLEAVYQEALEIELARREIPFCSYQRLTIKYKGVSLSKMYIADLVCYNKVILELKALSNLAPEHEAQLLNYLKATGYRLGILLNFGENSLTYKRMVI